MEKGSIIKLIEEALQARKASYSPYSHYAVGAALLTKEGSIIRGCNIENASYGATNCAERTAFFKAVSEGKKEFTAIAITGGPAGDAPDGFAYPCGICRQVMREFCDPGSFQVIVAKSIDEYESYTLEQLLPKSFGPDHLGA
ncbi:MAG: cytidine deaminase [Lachnospiraceae bacterium]|nr:cytidine deaminase [Lachnospiraceae bacterium]